MPYVIRRVLKRGVRYTAIYTDENDRTCLSAMLQMAWDHGYRDDNPVKGVRLKHPPSGPIVVATVPQLQRVYAALPNQPARSSPGSGCRPGRGTAS
jgi:hypothetical protein